MNGTESDLLNFKNENDYYSAKARNFREDIKALIVVVLNLFGSGVTITTIEALEIPDDKTDSFNKVLNIFIFIFFKSLNKNL